MGFLFKWRMELLSPIAGVLLTLAFAPYDYTFCAVISLVFVIFSWLDCSATRAALRAYLYALGLFGTGISWVYISIHDYGGAPVIGSLLLTVLVVFFWALFPALTAYISVRLVINRNRGSLVWLIPFVWIFVEYFRGYWFLNGFPWLQIAYTQLNTPLQGYVPVLGVYGTGFLLALTCACVVAALNKSIKLVYAIFMIAMIWGGGAYLRTVDWTDRAGEPISVALIQGNISQDQKWLPENRIKTLVKYKQLTVQNWQSDIIIWPETAIPAYLSQVKEFYLDPLAEEAKANNSDLIVSLPTRGKANEFYNSVITLGETSGRYNKNHLLPFGEYLPLQPLSGAVLKALNIHLGNFTSGGDNQSLLKAAGYPFATSICYEDAFNEIFAKSLPEAAFLVNVTNDAWFGDSIEPYQHMQIAQMRSLETGRYLLRATNTGVTAIVSPEGAILKQAPIFKQSVLKGEIYPMKGLTPYTMIGDVSIILVLLFGFLIVFGFNVRNDKR